MVPRPGVLIGCALVWLGCAELNSAEAQAVAKDVVGATSLSPPPCVRQVHDKDGYLMKACEYVMANNMSVWSHPNTWTIAKLEDARAGERPVLAVYFSCCRAGDKFLFDKASGQVIGFGSRPWPSRYPWDVRPEACMNGERAGTPECALNSWRSFDETVGRIGSLYQGEQFPLLERALTETASSNARFVSGHSTASAAYWAFRRMMPAPGVRLLEKDRVARWRAAIPQSHFAIFAEARFLYGNAWNSRGSGYAGSVSKEAWELFSMRLREAEQVLLHAPQPLKDTPLWHNLLLTIALDTDTVQSDPQTTFKRAVQAWPDYYDFYDLMLSRLVPVWGGSWEKVESFIDYWARQQVDREGTSLYARLYVNLGGQRVTPDETNLDWNRMNRSFVDLIARYPDPTFRNLYASYACFARDRTAFGNAMQGIPSNLLMPNYWLSGHSYEACLRWAGM